MKATKTRKVQTKEANGMSEDAFGDLKQALEDALAFERGKRRGLKASRIRGPARTERQLGLRSAKSETIPTMEPARKS
jgi:hypothetical protein